MNKKINLAPYSVVLGSALAAVAIFASGCDSGSAGSAPATSTSPSAQVPTPPGSGGGGGGGGSPGPVVVGDSCVAGDANKLCLAMHFVAYKDSNGTVVATTDQAKTIVTTMNQLWSQCDIGFQIEQYDAVDPTQYGLAYGSESQNQLDQIRQAFAQPNDMLLGVTTGPWGTSVNAWTNMPGDGTYGSIMEASIVDYGGGIIYAHEFGHYLGLDHVSDASNLMNPVIYTTSTALTSSQCQTAQQTATSYWAAMLRK